MINFVVFLFLTLAGVAFAQEQNDFQPADVASGVAFDDRALLEGYAQRYSEEPQDILLRMIEDDALGDYKCAAAVRVFKVNFADQLLAADKPGVIKILWHRLNHTDSAFVQVEIMHTLIIIDRYQYFENMVQGLILKMDHYNQVVSDLSYLNLLEVTKSSSRTREARIVFTVLRKTLFLSKNKLAKIKEPDARLRHKLDMLRWSIKILGTQELKRLPSEVIGLL